jgi:predicted  nucleic acid-binding Zn-ribbon protein
MEHKQHSMQELQDSLTIHKELLAQRDNDIASLMVPMQELQDSLTIHQELLAARGKDIASLQHFQKVLMRKYHHSGHRIEDKGRRIG